MRDPDKYSWGSSLHVPRVREPSVGPLLRAFLAILVGLGLAAWYVSR